MEVILSIESDELPICSETAGDIEIVSGLSEGEQVVVRDRSGLKAA
jgi:hypothetical protein